MSKVPYYLPETKEEETDYVSWFQNEREVELFRKLCVSEIMLFMSVDDAKKLDLSNYSKFVLSVRKDLSFKLSNHDVVSTCVYLYHLFHSEEK